jgi:L-2-hydroxyglutarate oxidase LhgO
MTDHIDCAVIGAGVVGLAVARSLALRGRDTIVLEAADAIGTLTSSRNSGVIHAGIYYPTGSLKARLCVAGRELLYEFCGARGVEVNRCGKLIVATSDAQVSKLTSIDATLVVNCAGLDAQLIAQRFEGLIHETIPKLFYAKGNYFGVEGRVPFRRLIYPVPEDGGLGVHLTLDLSGRARFGPDVEWVDHIDYRVDPARAESFYAAIRTYWPTLPQGALRPDYSGIRPKTLGPGSPAQDFIIQGAEVHGVPGLVNLYGIESPGLTAALAMGEYVAERAW